MGKIVMSVREHLNNEQDGAMLVQWTCATQCQPEAIVDQKDRNVSENATQEKFLVPDTPVKPLR